MQIIRVFVDKNVSNGDILLLIGRLALALAPVKAVAIIAESKEADLVVSSERVECKNYIVLKKNDGVEIRFLSWASFMDIKHGGDNGFWDSILPHPLTQ